MEKGLLVSVVQTREVCASGSRVSKAGGPFPRTPVWFAMVANDSPTLGLWDQSVCTWGFCGHVGDSAACVYIFSVPWDNKTGSPPNFLGLPRIGVTSEWFRSSASLSICSVADIRVLCQVLPLEANLQPGVANPSIPDSHTPLACPSFCAAGKMVLARLMPGDLEEASGEELSSFEHLDVTTADVLVEKNPI